MKISFKSLLVMLYFGLVTTAYSQHNHTSEENAASPITFTHVLGQALSDSALICYELQSSVMEVAPGAIDTVSHRHDCELFGYVLEGELQIALIAKELKTFSAGQMFYEKRNILHTVTRNPSRETPTRILLIFIIKNGRKGYTREY